MLFRVHTGLAAVAAVLAAASPAAAGPPSPAAPGPASLAAPGPAPRPVAGSRLTLTRLAGAGQAATVKLTCDPAGGGHPKASQACAELARAGADPARLKPADRYCFLLYKPITAQLSGTWRGRAVKWARTYGNSCEMNRATGVLFDF